MAHRYTIKQLEEWDDLFVMGMILSERKSQLTNMYSPLAQRIGKIQHNINIGNIFSCQKGKVFDKTKNRCIKK